MPEIDPNIIVMVVVGTLSSLYGMSKYYAFRVSENRKQREHLQKQRKTKLEYELSGKKLNKMPELGELVGKLDIKKLLTDVEDEEDIEELNIPGWLKPLAKGFLAKFSTDAAGEETEKLQKIKKTNY